MSRRCSVNGVLSYISILIRLWRGRLPILCRQTYGIVILVRIYDISSYRICRLPIIPRFLSTNYSYSSLHSAKRFFYLPYNYDIYMYIHTMVTTLLYIGYLMQTNGDRHIIVRIYNIYNIYNIQHITYSCRV